VRKRDEADRRVQLGATVVHAANPLVEADGMLTRFQAFVGGFPYESPNEEVCAFITDAVTSGGLIKVKTLAAHGLATDDTVTIADVLGTTEANGSWSVTVVDGDEFTLQGSTFSNTYASGGIAQGTTVMGHKCFPTEPVAESADLAALDVGIEASVLPLTWPQ
jgi:hypothetical protein